MVFDKILTELSEHLLCALTFTKFEIWQDLIPTNVSSETSLCRWKQAIEIPNVINMIKKISDVWSIWINNEIWWFAFIYRVMVTKSFLVKFYHASCCLMFSWCLYGKGGGGYNICVWECEDTSSSGFLCIKVVCQLQHIAYFETWFHFAEQFRCIRCIFITTKQ